MFFFLKFSEKVSVMKFYMSKSQIIFVNYNFSKIILLCIKKDLRLEHWKNIGFINVFLLDTKHEAAFQVLYRYNFFSPTWNMKICNPCGERLCKILDGDNEFELSKHFAICQLRKLLLVQDKQMYYPKVKVILFSNMVIPNIGKRRGIHSLNKVQEHFQKGGSTVFFMITCGWQKCFGCKFYHLIHQWIILFFY